MTDFVLSSGSQIAPHRSPYGGFPIKHLAISTGLTTNAIYKGSLVCLDKTSTLHASVQRSSAVGAPYIVGYAAEAASTHAVGTTIAVYEADPRVEFRGATKNGVLNSTYVGEQKTVAYDSTLNIHYVDLVDSTVANYRVIVTQLIDAVGDSGGYVAFRHMTQGLRNSSVQSTVNILAFYF